MCVVKVKQMTKFLLKLNNSAVVAVAVELQVYVLVR